MAPEDRDDSAGRPPAEAWSPGKELDLHGFRPADVASLLDEYLGHAQEQGWHDVLIVHGRGRMILARSVHSLLERDPRVLGHAWSSSGPRGAGVTRVRIRAR